jgi:hypothetical protein
MVTAAMPRSGRRRRLRREQPQPETLDLQRAAYETVAAHGHFRGRVDQFQFVQCDDGLVVRGRVPSFYLKQVLQTALLNMSGVHWIDNQVDVVSCYGLSSVRDA